MKENKQAIRKALLLGLGAASITADAIEKVVQGIRDLGEINESEARELVESIASDAVKRQAGIGKKIREEMTRAYGRSPLATKSELAKLEARVAKIEARAAKRKCART